MNIAPEERSSRGPLIAFIDLLFLLVAFFTLLLFFVQQRQQISQQSLEAVQQNLARITGEQVDVPQALETLERMVERVVASREQEQERERLLAERQKRRERRDTVRLEYTIGPSGRIVHEGKTYSAPDFLERVVTPLRKSKWVAFRAYAAPETPFGAVVDHRQLLLKDSNEFDTYWDNVARTEQAPAAKAAR
ncbi:MAG TPA: hypothetical protein VGC20_11365 [bacterium]